MAGERRSQDLTLGREQAYARWLGHRLMFAGAEGDWPAAVRGCLNDPLPHGLVVASLGTGGIELRAGPRPYTLPDGGVEVGVLLDSRLPDATRIDVDGAAVPLASGGVELVTVTGSGGRAVTIAAATTPRRCNGARACT